MKLKKLYLPLLMALFLSFGSAFAADKVNVNTAGLEELQTLIGVGATTAAAIIEYREQVGPYTSVDDLVNVKGIGEKKVATLSTQVIVEIPEQL
ncbi:MAG: competence protein ComEA [Methylophaga sp.]|nr:MAG: competence protein ComEA [Methylophaga sp.]